MLVLGLQATSFDKIPTLNEQSLKNFEIKVWHGVYTLKGTPKAEIDKLAKALQGAIQDPLYKQHMAELGVEIPRQANATPEGLKNTSKHKLICGLLLLNLLEYM